MCGRFTQAYTWHELVALYRLTQPAVNLQAHYNIAPTDTVDVVTMRDGKVELAPMRWGLVPWWWKKPLKELPATFNARAETVATKPMFRDAFKRSRCVIPASGYYEWQPTPTGKQPYYITSADGAVLSFAGLWDQWHNVETGERVVSCTIIVTAANDATRAIHDRMPVVLAKPDVDAWLAGAAGPELLRPAPSDALHLWPVSRRVNRTSQADDPRLIEPLAEAPEQAAHRATS
jgi:putative SOS response-associated peptidase YedK